MQIKPYKTNILVKPVEKEQPLGESLCEYGDVIAVGWDVVDIKVGDRIGYTVWGVNRLEINDEKHYFIPNDPQFILGVIEM